MSTKKGGITKRESASLFLVIIVYSLVLWWVSGHASEQLQTSQVKMSQLIFLELGTQVNTARKWTIVTMELAGKIKSRKDLSKVVYDNLIPYSGKLSREKTFVDFEV